MARKHRRSRFASEAAQEALVRFGPELSGLRELQRQAKENYKTTVSQAHGNARGIIGAVDRAKPELRKVYDQAGLDEARTAHFVGGDIGALPGVANSIRAGAQLEASSAAQRLRDARTSALGDLAQRRVSAKEGEQFAVQSAHSELVDALAKVLNRKQDLAQERGAFTSLTTHQLRREATQEADRLSIARGTRNQSERNSIRSSGVDPDTGKPIPGGRLDPAAKPRKPGKRGETRGGATRVQLGSASDEIGRLVNEVKTLRRAGGSRGEISSTLRAGAKDREIPLHDPSTGKPLFNRDGTPRTKTIPGLDKAKSQLLLDVALDVALDGYVSRANHRKLLSRGLAVRDLGLPSYGQYRRRAARNAPRYKPPNNTQTSPKYGAH